MYIIQPSSTPAQIYRLYSSDVIPHPVCAAPAVLARITNPSQNPAYQKSHLATHANLDCGLCISTHRMQKRELTHLQIRSNCSKSDAVLACPTAPSLAGDSSPNPRAIPPAPRQDGAGTSGSSGSSLAPPALQTRPSPRSS